MQILGQEEVKSFLSEHIQEQTGVRFHEGRCRCELKGPHWRDLLDTISELLTHHLQQVVALGEAKADTPPPPHPRPQVSIVLSPREAWVNHGHSG